MTAPEEIPRERALRMFKEAENFIDLIEQLRLASERRGVGGDANWLSMMEERDRARKERDAALEEAEILKSALRLITTLRINPEVLEAMGHEDEAQAARILMGLGRKKMAKAGGEKGAEP